ncbi:MAG: metallophosphoesterase family protein [Bacteroidia bacterium]|nr:metallophosphoesterase family protein [Bacteroidia bacterium]
MRKTIGLISDTHGLLRPEAVEALKGSDIIIHAGDIGKAEILEELAKIAPVYSIRGNIDKADWCQEYPETEVVEYEGLFCYVIHDLNDLDLDPKAAGFQVVISGHSHKPKEFIKEDVLYINPGSAGKRRFKLPITCAKLYWDGEVLESERFELIQIPS